MRRSFWVSRVKAGGFIIAMAVASLLMGLYAVNQPFLENLEEKSLDLRFHIRGVRDPGSSVAIVQVDEKSIKALGRYQQWSRARMAELLARLKEAGARVVAFDIIFSERQAGLTPGQAALLEARAGDIPGLKRFITASVSGDQAFRDALSGYGKGVLPLVFDVPIGKIYSGPVDQAPSNVEASAFMAARGDEKAFPDYMAADGVTPPIGDLGEAASSLGHINAYLDRDGAMRWEALVLKYGDEYYPSLGLAAAREYLGIPRERMQLEFGKGVRLGSIEIPTDEHGRMLINYCGPDETFKYYSFSDVLKGDFPQGAFRDKVVLVGTTAQGLYDLKVTPFSANMPGVEKHANVIENILGGNFLVRGETAKPLCLLTILAVGLVLGLALPRLGAFSGATVALALLSLGWGAGYAAFAYRGIWLDMAYPTIAVALIFISITSYRFLTEERRARSIKRIFASYLTPKMVDALARNPELAKLGGERKEITVLFSDVKGFTTFSESRQPEEVVARLNEYMGEMTDIIFAWDGTVDKFVGDAIMAFWGAPLPQEDHAERAVLCAAEMVKRLKELHVKWSGEGMEILDMGIGINTGEMVVGNMGAEGKKMDYTVIGDSVNLGARVESLTRKYESRIIISEYTYNKIMDRAGAGSGMVKDLAFTDLGSVKVKGKENPVTIYRVEA